MHNKMIDSEQIHQRELSMLKQENSELRTSLKKIVPASKLAQVSNDDSICQNHVSDGQDDEQKITANDDEDLLNHHESDDDLDNQDENES